MGLFSKLFHGIYYVVDTTTLRKYMEEELEFSKNNNLEASANFNLYLNGNKIHIQVWDYSASSFEDEKVKGLIVYYNDIELKSIDELFNNYLMNLPQYFKIELIDADNDYLNEYKKAHPELNPNDYN